MPVATTLKTSGSDNTDRTGPGSSYTTAVPGSAFAANSLAEIWIAAASSAASLAAPAVAGGGMTTWTLVETIQGGSTGPIRVQWCFRSMQASPGVAAAITITPASGETWTACDFDVTQTTGVDTSGTNGAGAVGPVTKAGSASAATTTGPKEVYCPNPADGMIAATSFGNTTATPDTDWIELADHVTSAPVVGQAIAWRATNDPLASVAFAASTHWAFLAHALIATPSATMSHGPAATFVSPTSVRITARTHNQAATLKVRYSLDSGLTSPITTAGVATVSGDDYTGTVTVTGLTADTLYYYDVLVNDVSQIGSPYATVRTPPADGTAGTYTFCCLSDQNAPANDDARAVAVYASIDAQAPRFVIQHGDFDHRFDTTTVIDELRAMHKSLRSGLTVGNAFRDSILKKYAVFHTWDDHDYGQDNGNKTFALRTSSLQAFKESWPAAGPGFAPGGGDGIWQAPIYGNADFFVLDLRSQADPNDSNLSLLGTAQKAWLKAGLSASTKKWKFVISSRPWNSSTKPADGWGNFATERAEIRDHIVTGGIAGVVWISGDLHSGGGIDLETAAGPGMLEVTSPHTNGVPGDSGPEGYWSEYFHSGDGGTNGYLAITYTSTTVTIAIKDHAGATRFTFDWDGFPRSGTGCTAQVASFNTGTGSSPIVVTGVGFKPRAIILWSGGQGGTVDAAGRSSLRCGVGFIWNNQRRCVGTVSTDAVGTSAARSYPSKDHSFVIPHDTGAIDGSLGDCAMDADGFTIEIDNAFAVDLRIHALCLGGPDLDGLVDDWSQISTTGDGTFPPSGTAGLPFSPDLLLFAGNAAANPLETNAQDSQLVFGAADRNGNQGVLLTAADHAAATSKTRSYASATGCLGHIHANLDSIDDLASFVAMTANGFTLNWSANSGTARRHLFMALKFRGQTMGRVGNVLTRTDTTQFSITPLGCTPKAALFLSACKGAGAGLVTSAQWSMGGATSPSNRAAHATLDEDSQATAEVVSTAVEHDEVYVNLAAGGTVQGLMDVVSMVDPIELVMDDADPSAAFVWYAAIGSATLHVVGTGGATAGSGAVMRRKRAVIPSGGAAAATTPGIVIHRRRKVAPSGAATAGSGAVIDRRRTAAPVGGAVAGSGGTIHRKRKVAPVGGAVASSTAAVNLSSDANFAGFTTLGPLAFLTGFSAGAVALHLTMSGGAVASGGATIRRKRKILPSGGAVAPSTLPHVLVSIPSTDGGTVLTENPRTLPLAVTTIEATFQVAPGFHYTVTWILSNASGSQTLVMWTSPSVLAPITAALIRRRRQLAPSGSAVAGATTIQRRKRKILPSGQATAVSAAPGRRTRKVLPSGAAVSGGTATFTTGTVTSIHVTMTGGAVTGSGAIFRRRRAVPVGDAGAVASSAALIRRKRVRIVGVNASMGAAVASGVAGMSRRRTMVGNGAVIASGAATQRRRRQVTPTGGAVSGSSAISSTTTALHVVMAGGAVASGVALIRRRRQLVPAGGAVSSGEAVMAGISRPPLHDIRWFRERGRAPTCTDVRGSVVVASGDP